MPASEQTLAQRDAAFIVKESGLARQTISEAIQRARVPDLREVQEQFRACAARFLA